ncbi:peptidase S9 [Tepiditoga spiralis]|uniref:Peptidase S9 n=1 Tax=Tepiditoga spiralis TaxID=2108365 RepID=A0A7G1G9C3_9BACT|nr:S9 family peptidase [Tepiditoga spiralis]BBE31814.1 peptidase S9 [Tepiditoga spiralis]
MEKLTLDEFTKFKYISTLKFSPDGEKICFVQHEADMKKNGYNSYLWIYNNERLYKLTSFGKEKNYLWLDDENILFPSMREENNDKDKKRTIFYKINVNGGEAIKDFEVEEKITGIKRINDDKFLITVIMEEESEKDYKVFDEIPFWINGQGFSNKKRNTLCIYDKKTSKIEKITERYENVGGYDILNEKIVFVSNTYENKMEKYNEIKLYDIKNKKIETIISVSNKLNFSKPFLIDDETIIVPASDMKLYGINENKKFYKINIKTKDIKCITPNFDASLWNSVGTDSRFGGNEMMIKKNEHIYFVSTQEYYSKLFKINKEGKIEKVIDEEGTVDGYDIFDEKVVFTGLKGLKLQELYLNGKQITSFNTWVLEKSLSIPEKIEIESNGDKIVGWIMKPIDFDENKKYSAILDIHGGPKTVYSDIYYHEMQYWTNRDYVVFYCNPHGSDGRGNEFADIRGKYGTIDFEDIMNFTKYVVEKYTFIDKEKIGVTGGSYGGFMTNWIIGNTDFFKAAASQRSISNWISMGMTTDIGYYFAEDQMDTNPWNGFEKMWNQSPLKFADKAKTPTLFIHSDEDYRCYMPEAIQMFTALKYHGVESKFVLFHGENHELSRGGKPEHRIRRLKEITEWMDKYLKK